MTDDIERPAEVRSVVTRVWQCPNKAEWMQEFYSLRNGNLFGSLDAVIYSCDRHHLAPQRTAEDARDKTPKVSPLTAADSHPPCGVRVDTALQASLMRIARLDRGQR